MEILLLLTLQPHNLAHPQPFSDGEVGESPFGFPRAAFEMGPSGEAAVAAAFHRWLARIRSRKRRSRG